MSSDAETMIIKEKLKPYEKWRDKFKDDWKYKQKLVVFEDINGNVVTPTTTTTTTTTPRPNVTIPSQNVTKYTHPTKFSSVVVITTSDPRSGQVSTADTTELIKIVGFTCASLIGLLLLALLVIRLCRKSSSKRKERVTVRRPLHDTEREEHIYAEIEPLQIARTSSTGGASGTSCDIPLPSKKVKKRRPGVSSFRSLSTRIYRFFNVESDNQSVFYNQTSQRATVDNAPPPEPPERNGANGRRTKRVNRGESTASRRPLLDGESRTDDSRDSMSSASEMRNNIYNPLLRETEGRTPSGPYDHLTLSKTQSGNIRDSEPSSPHDYFTLEKTARETNPDESDELNNENTPESNSGARDMVMIENELQSGINTILEEDAETPKSHEYFILEPHQRESAKDTDESGTPSNGSVKSNQSHSISRGSSKAGSPVKDTKAKPDITPRVTKSTEEEKSTTQSGPTSSSNELSSPYEVAKDTNDSMNNTEEINISESKEDTYVLSKLGDAPEPPSSEGVDEDEYLSPVNVNKKPDYMYVLPNPPPRSTSLQAHAPCESKNLPHSSSLQAHELGESKNSEQLSPVHSSMSPKQDRTSPTHKSGNVSPNRQMSPKHGNVSPNRQTSPEHDNVSPTHSKGSQKHNIHTSTSHKPVSPTHSKVETDI